METVFEKRWDDARKRKSGDNRYVDGNSFNY